MDVKTRQQSSAPRTARPPDPGKTGPATVLRRLAGIALGIAGIALILHLDQRLQDNASLPELGQDMSFGLLFTVGLLTGFHCVAMCGPLVIGYTAKGASSGRHTYLSHLLYGAGKTLSYTVIGAAFGWLGSIIAFTPLVRGAVGIAAGVFLILFGLHMLHVFPALAHFHIKPPAALMHFVGTQYRKHSNPFLIGLLNGLMIVCGPLQALYVMAMGTGDPVEAGKLLFVFGLGTLPVMLSFGFLTS
ncbi:MAG: sulfite exporter TauE/SafE family protein, partial [Gammaproteobacteria bacterium]|nr:sulfite exporter TauE/SafE family protein [Gammaproteobacteria bacterium]